MDYCIAIKMAQTHCYRKGRSFEGALLRGVLFRGNTVIASTILQLSHVLLSFVGPIFVHSEDNTTDFILRFLGQICIDS